ISRNFQATQKCPRRLDEDVMALVYHDPIFLEHLTGPHPESPQRLQHLLPCLERQGTLDNFTRGEFTPATPEQLAAVHDPEYIAALEQFSARGGGRIERDTVMSRQSYEVARHAAGAGIAAVDAVLSGPERRAVCLIRPPGH